MSDTPVTTIAVHSIVVPPERMRKLRDDVVDSLTESIAERGLLQPIIVRPRGATNYWLVAGRHRLEAVRKCGHSHIHAIVRDGLNADAALLVEIDENLARADLSPAERALHLAERKRLYEKLHPETKRGVAGGKARHGQQTTLVSFAEMAAPVRGRSKRTVQREIERADKIPGLAEVIGTTLDNPAELDALAKLPEAAQRDLIARARTGEKVKVSVALKRVQRERRESELADAARATSLSLGQKVYGVIYADPPWKYDNIPFGDLARTCELHYPPMALEEICALPAPATATCVLFLWATIPLLEKAFTVVNAWGFSHQSASVWKKDKAGIGYWVRGQCELLLIATRGNNVPKPAPGEQFPAIIEAPRSRHSEKPAVFAEHIERLFPNVPKLEMFARKARPGWDAWGNEAPPAMEAQCANKAAEESEREIICQLVGNAVNGARQ
jgi:N6-adenosine-specific RNA methylase IME4/ParB-like chromosome segregation protein Spo0J